MRNTGNLMSAWWRVSHASRDKKWTEDITHPVQKRPTYVPPEDMATSAQFQNSSGYLSPSPHIPGSMVIQSPLLGAHSLGHEGGLNSSYPGWKHELPVSADQDSGNREEVSIAAPRVLPCAPTQYIVKMLNARRCVSGRDIKARYHL